MHSFPRVGILKFFLVNLGNWVINTENNYKRRFLQFLVHWFCINRFAWSIDAQSFSNSFEGVHGVVKKSGRGSSIFVFYCIFMLQFFKVFWGGTWGAPLLPPCVHLWPGGILSTPYLLPYTFLMDFNTNLMNLLVSAALRSKMATVLSNSSSIALPRLTYISAKAWPED